jgi:DNA polymerase-2
VTWGNVNNAKEQPPLPPLTQLCLDIETLIKADPVTKELLGTDEDPIPMIAMRYEKRAVMLVVGSEVESPWVHETDWEIQYYPTEKELLEAILRFINSVDPDFITGYNHIKFDLPRIVKRCEAHGILCDFSRLANFETRVVHIIRTNNQTGSGSVTFVDSPGRVLLDVHVQVKKSQKLREYTLKAVAETFELKVKKGDVEYHEIWDLFHGTPQQRARLAEYCAMDVDVCMAIEKRLAFITETIGFSNKCYLLPREFLNATPSFLSRRLDAAFMGTFKQQMLPWGVKAPALYLQSPAIVELIERGSYIGGKVQEPICKLHEGYTIVLDFRGLYTSIMMANNISYDTFVGDEAMARARGMDPKDLIEMPNHFFVVPHAVRKGVLVNMLEQLADQRAKVKKIMKSFPPDSNEYAVHDASQNALKLSGNSKYGLLGAPGGNPALAEGVTMFGRHYITAVREWIEKHYPQYPVIYGDTDSLFIFVGKERSPEALNRARAIGNEITNRLNTESGIYPRPM